MSTDNELDLDQYYELNDQRGDLKKHDTTLKVTDEGTFVKAETVTAIKTVGGDDENDDYSLSKNKNIKQGKIAPPSVNVIKSIVKKESPIDAVNETGFLSNQIQSGKAMGLEPSIT